MDGGPSVSVMLSAIHGVLQDDSVCRFTVAVKVLYRIYTQHLGCSYPAYWRLIMSMKIKIFVDSVQRKEPRQTSLEKLRDLLSGSDFMFNGEVPRELITAKQKQWNFLRTVLPLVSCSNSNKVISPNYGIALKRKIIQMFEMFQSSVMDTLLPSDLENKSKEKNDHSSSLENKENIDQMGTGNSVEADDDDTSILSEILVSQDTNITHKGPRQASLLWNRESCVGDALSVVSPSVSETGGSVQLSDFEKMAEFDDNEVALTPDLGSFLKTFQNEKRH